MRRFYKLSTQYSVSGVFNLFCVLVYMAVRNLNSQLGQVIPVGHFVHTKLLLIMYGTEKCLCTWFACVTLVILIVLLCN